MQSQSRGYERPQHPVQHGMFASRSCDSGRPPLQHGSTSRYNQLREDHTTVAVDMADVELSLVEGFAQRLEISQGCRTSYREAVATACAVSTASSTFSCSHGPPTSKVTVPMPDKFERICEHFHLANAIIDEIVCNHDVHLAKFHRRAGFNSGSAE